LLVETLRDGLADPEPQAGEATYAAKLTADDLHLDWSRPAVELDRVVRVGGAWTTFRGRRLKVLDAEPARAAVPLAPGEIGTDVVGTGAGALRLITVQPEGKARQAFADWHRGTRPQPGEKLGP
jgi:methionyl-tRNA formyltransferase